MSAEAMGAAHDGPILGAEWTLPGAGGLIGEWFTSGELRIQRCSGCTQLLHPPEEVCHACGATEFDHVTAAPTGTVYSYTVAHYAAHPALADHVPYAVVLVSLDEHPEVRVIGNVIDVAPEAVHIGMAVRATWEERSNGDGDTVRVPQWVTA